ncbi:hypothetical protein [Pantoea dispersa]|uniref:hypothetical protein n=1 Tax=Pantoea dispersa TaxID=59814 RepID=UPI0021C987B9|nr:hypothetical protein [Pantoea dispersa]UXO68918.1 hypothetical protein N7977_02445 [Pantoea dispersa]
MADPFSTIIGHLANLVSFKSSLRLLVIAGAIIASWVWVQPELKPLQIPAELQLTIIVAIGFSIGALLTSVTFAIFDCLRNFISATNEKRIKSKKDIQDKENELEIIKNKNKLLVNSFDSYSFHAKSILLKLLNKDDSIKLEDFYKEYNDAFKGLLEGKIVLILKVIDKRVSFCTINPIYKDTLTQLFEDKHKNEVDQLFAQKPEGFDKLISLFKDVTREENHIFEIDNSVFGSKFSYQPAIKYKKYSEGEFIGDCNIQFYIDDHHLSYMVEKAGQQLKEYILCKHIED